MSDILLIFLAGFPFAVFGVALLLPNKRETLLSRWVWGGLGLHGAALLVLVWHWASQGAPVLALKHLVLYQTPDFEFALCYYFDMTTAVFAVTGGLLFLLVAVFSRFYMHREAGFNRFFNTFLLFWCGYNALVFAGNFETFFVGWEMIGISSFLLIAFYRDRYLPVRNAFKVLSFYRLGDVCFMLAIWMCHHIWHRNIQFSEWADTADLQQHLAQHTGPSLFVALMLVVAAAIKSAQLPFSTWLPRAMEGPTTSSAIFYGALSIHAGAFLLLRTYPFWQNQPFVVGLLVALGLGTALVANAIGKVQTSVKVQIAYASIAQLGLMFVEIALGFHTLALVHFVGNACLRAYQLLVSPSVLSYLIHDMMFHFKPAPATPQSAWLRRWHQAFFVLALKEWNLDYWLHRYGWAPFKWIGKQVNGAGEIWWKLGTAVLMLLGAWNIQNPNTADGLVQDLSPVVCAAFALLLVLRAFAQRGDAQGAWLSLVASQLLLVMGMVLGKGLDAGQALLYLGGTLLAGLLGYAILGRARHLDPTLDLAQYQGRSYDWPGMSLLFLVTGLTLAGFPISPTFIGVDLVFVGIHDTQLLLIVLVGLNFLFLELAILRIYARVFMGQHVKNDHPIAFKTS